MATAPTAPTPPTAPPRAPRASGRAWLLALLVGLLTAALAYALMPVGSRGPLEFTGPEAVAEPVRASLDGVEHQVQALEVGRDTGTGREYVAAGEVGGPGGTAAPGPVTHFETGSVFKVFTAMTLADMVDKGELELDTTLGEVFDEVEFADPRMAGVTLEELATHRSGMPAVPTGYEAAGTGSMTMGMDPYRAMPSAEEGLAVTRLGARDEFAYSNLGFMVLGRALARVSGTDFPDLVRERIFDPVKMDDTFVLGADRAEVPEDTALPHREMGQRVQTWRAPDWAPAGVGTFTTADDLLRFGAAVRDGEAPGMAAVEPRAEAGGKVRIGLAWFTAKSPGGAVRTLHDGKTGGSSSLLAFDDDQVVVALSNSGQVSAGQAALAALGEQDIPLASEDPFVVDTGTAAASTLPLVVLPPLFALALMLRRRTLVGQRHLDRLRVVSMPLGAFALVLSGLTGFGWAIFPHALWAGAVGAVAAALTVGLSLAPALPTVRARWAWLRVAFFAVSVTASLLLIAFTGWTLAVLDS
ncbi:CubicO group peptidase (beta-lactamase class C family) [Murinocardiopsis flavida]|uniref:CubicO group peptidase (Beta-lactamase class C family) n=1 Tax=Murinocardiopsis flavida TaxID=645275 RepID=A0A2P8DII8_9ACTN|nr:serine hydrolase domain-containing protein [Murinocardiopsis flavida]PSK97008.1 CubicO group peptidase (beta-lactamase class C family) [Murinocardiopsis flavida]